VNPKNIFFPLRVSANISKVFLFRFRALHPVLVRHLADSREETAYRTFIYPP